MDDDDQATPAPTDSRTRARFERLKQQGTDAAVVGASWIEKRRTEFFPLDLGFTYYERDREALASVLGAAIALRLYLFLIPAMITLVGLVLTLFGKDQLDSMLTSSSLGTTVAKDISSAAPDTGTAGIVLMVGGIWLTLWAGRSLAKGLAACAGRAWRLDPKLSKATMTAIGGITAMTLLMLTASMALARIRSLHGVAASGTSWVLTAALFAAAWFAISLFLPRATQDPGALLPGAAFVGLSLTLLQWFMQFYLPREISQSSALAGDLGFSMAMLGYLFLVGRLMAASFVVDAVIYEEIGSLSQFVFELPVVRAIPRRYPVVGEFFALPGFEVAVDAEASLDETQRDE